MDMRTTLALDDDATKTLQSFARGTGLSLGKAASELIRRGAQYRLKVKKVNGFPVFDLPPGFPVVTSRQVKDILDED
jgi:hypothetical protein